jgi:hypothetical protein
MKLPHRIPGAPENNFKPSPEFARAWAVFNLLSRPENRTPELLAEARKYPQIVFVD